MDHKKLFKALLACTASGDTLGMLQFIYKAVETDETETLVAVDGRIIACVCVAKDVIEQAISSGIIVRHITEHGTFYRDSTCTNIPDSCYPSFEKTIPHLYPIGTENMGSKQFDYKYLKKASDLFYEYCEYNPKYCKKFMFSHTAKHPTSVSVRIEKGILIGIVPIIPLNSSSYDEVDGITEYGEVIKSSINQ
jgi:hypothetical protein